MQSRQKSSARVLLVEPSTDDREMHAEYLRLRGFQPIACRNTPDAPRRARNADVIVTGIRVPGPF